MVRKIILDVDTGVDDALALLLALRSPELEVVGITCVAGNVTIDRVVRNTLAVLDVAGAPDIPVAVGARKPLMATLRTATYFHGDNGLANLNLPLSLRRPVEEDASAFLTRMAAEHGNDLSVVAVGPMTNIALAVNRDAAFARAVAELVLMGGAVSAPGNASGAAEANFSNDPEAAAAVVESGATIRLVDLGASTQVVLTAERLESAAQATPMGRFARGLLDFYGPVCVSAGAEGAVLHDPLAVGLAALPDLATFIPLHLAIETAGVHTRGASVGSFSGLRSTEKLRSSHRDVVGLEPQPFNATLARRIDAPRFLDLFLARLELT